MKNLLYLLPLFLTNLSFGQQPCSCETALTNIVAKVEHEYPGFAAKTKDTLLYNNFKVNLKKELMQVDDENCLAILEKYVAYFKDRHIWILSNKQVQASLTAVATSKEILKLDVAKFKKEVLKSNDLLVGIWKNDGYEIGIKKMKTNEYVGFIITADPAFWKPNEIKFKLFSNNTFEYKMQDHSVQRGAYTVDADGFLYFKEILTELVKEKPNASLTIEQINDKTNQLNGFYCKRLTAKTSIFKLSNFSYPFVPAIEQLIAKNKDLLKQSENLIIDLRGNGGGTDNAYQKLLPYILTNPTRYMGAEYLASPSLINGMKIYLSSLKDKVKNKQEIENIEKRISLYEANLGKYVSGADQIVTVDTIHLESKSPKQIVFLTDDKVASAAENFLLVAKQSKKVKVIGIPTAGVLDYANVYRFNDLACPNYQLWMPTYRSLRLPNYPIDNIGIQPDIFMDQTVVDWEKFAVVYLEH